MQQQLIQEIGDQLYVALRNAQPIEAITSVHPHMTIEDAYQVQQRMLTRRLQDGEKVVGKKIGLTSQAVMSMLGVSQPDFGYLFDAMQVPDGSTINLNQLIQPKAEGEIAFIMGQDLIGTNLTESDVLAATAYVAPCFEIVDSRIRDWKIKIQDTVADNASCGLFVIGEGRVSPHGLNLSQCEMVFEKNGQIIGQGTGAASMGSPVKAVTWLVNTLGQFGVGLKAGEVVLSGALAAMSTCAAGDQYKVSIGGIGSCSVCFA